jgi:hypothetical protein
MDAPEIPTPLADLANMGSDWTRIRGAHTHTGHPERRVGAAYTSRFWSCVLARKPLADCRDEAFAEAERVAREVRAERDAQLARAR